MERFYEKKKKISHNGEAYWCKSSLYKMKESAVSDTYQPPTGSKLQAKANL